MSWRIIITLWDFGTKNYYLPKLTNGEFVPCFGLTGPNNSLDITGSNNIGTLIELDGKKLNNRIFWLI